MFARDWRGVASAPASIVADPVRCVSNAAGAADDGSGVVAIVGKDKKGRLVDLSGLNDELDETFGHDLPENIPSRSRAVSASDNYARTPIK